MKIEGFGAWMLGERKCVGLSQKELGALIGAHQVTVSKLELGQREPTLREALLIAAALGGNLPAIDAPPLAEFCLTCHGRPPAGFICQTCGASS